MILKSYPYLLFRGCCEAALNTYRQIFDGKILELERMESLKFPMPDNVARQIFHAVFRAEGLYFMACDTFPGYEATVGQNVSLVVDFCNVQEAKQCFDLLRQGGKMVMPFSDTPWSLGYGKTCDQFGILWDINVPRAKEVSDREIYIQEILKRLNGPRPQELLNRDLYIRKVLKDVQIPKMQEISDRDLYIQKVLKDVNISHFKHAVPPVESTVPSI